MDSERDPVGLHSPSNINVDSNLDGLKEAFKKTVQNQFLPGWVWLAVSKNADGTVGQLVLQQTNN